MVAVGYFVETAMFGTISLLILAMYLRREWKMWKEGEKLALFLYWTHLGTLIAVVTCALAVDIRLVYGIYSPQSLSVMLSLNSALAYACSTLYFHSVLRAAMSVRSQQYKLTARSQWDKYVFFTLNAVVVISSVARAVFMFAFEDDQQKTNGLYLILYGSTAVGAITIFNISYFTVKPLLTDQMKKNLPGSPSGTHSRVVTSRSYRKQVKGALEQLNMVCYYLTPLTYVIFLACLAIGYRMWDEGGRTDPRDEDSYTIGGFFSGPGFFGYFYFVILCIMEAVMRVRQTRPDHFEHMPPSRSSMSRAVKGVPPSQRNLVTPPSATMIRRESSEENMTTGSRRSDAAQLPQPVALEPVPVGLDEQAESTGSLVHKPPRQLDV